jgi:hypothetical protein
MGLDQYLYRETYVKRWKHETEDKSFTVNVSKGGHPYKYVNPEKVVFVKEEVMYWRKANQIHNWFVKNVQNGEDDCGTHYVHYNQLRELVSLCEQVLENRDKASELLPSQGGFFFGSTEYDEGYYRDLEDTVEMLKPLLKEAEQAESERVWFDLYYMSSW